MTAKWVMTTNSKLFWWNHLICRSLYITDFSLVKETPKDTLCKPQNYLLDPSIQAHHLEAVPLDVSPAPVSIGFRGLQCQTPYREGILQKQAEEFFSCLWATVVSCVCVCFFNEHILFWSYLYLGGFFSYCSSSRINFIYLVLLANDT